MRADRAKQLLKNGVYRAIGETVTGVGGLDGEGERTLRVLMYHKVNDVEGNSVTVPTGQFDEQMAQLIAERANPSPTAHERQTGERHFHGARDAELHFLGRKTRCGSEHDDLIVGEVGERVRADGRPHVGLA